MILKTSVSVEAGNGVTITHSSEVVTDTTDEAYDQGEQFAQFATAFNKGFSEADVD